MLPTFTVFGLTIPMYGVMSAIGMLAAFVLVTYTRKQVRLSEDQMLSVAIWAVLLGFVGAKVLYWLVEFRQILADPAYLIRTLREGFVFYGALLGGLGGVGIYAARHKLPFFGIVDSVVPAVTLAHAFGRIGCFFAGCCYGMECDSFISVVFPAGGLAPAGVALLPTQLMESAFLFLLTVYLLAVLRRKKPFGTVTAWYLLLYGVWRFVIEFFRNDERGWVGLLSTSQFISIFLVIGGILLLVLVKAKVLKFGYGDMPEPVEPEPKKKKDKGEPASDAAEPDAPAGEPAPEEPKAESEKKQEESKED